MSLSARAAEKLRVGPPNSSSATEISDAVNAAIAGSLGATAGGDLAGTYPNPSVAALTTTTGPTSLVIGACVDGALLQRVGATVVTISAYSTTGGTSGTTGGSSGTALKIDGAATGGSGSSAYTLGDIVAALKAAKILAP